jgi:hypothetical protein
MCCDVWLMPQLAIHSDYIAVDSPPHFWSASARASSDQILIDLN